MLNKRTKLLIQRYDNGVDNKRNLFSEQQEEGKATEGVRVMEIPSNLPVICPNIIGRTSELTTLRLLIEQAKSGKGHVALISGEAGVCKTRPAGAAQAHSTPHQFLPSQGDLFPTDVSPSY